VQQLTALAEQADDACSLLCSDTVAAPAATGYSPTVRLAAYLASRGAEGDSGMTTAEYGVGTVAACGFGGVLYKVVTSDAVSGLLKGIIEKALSVSFL
jgi:hypothetical protein